MAASADASAGATKTIFVGGASGYIGFSVARALSRAGHKVFGLVRSAAKGKALEAAEIVPVIGDATKPETYREAIEKSDVVIDATTFPYSDPTAYTEAFLAATVADGKKRVFIYTSGILANGDHPGVQFDDDDVVPFAPVAWRTALEARLREDARVHGIVVRPGFVYGGSAGMFGGAFFPEPVDGKLVVAGRPDKKWSWVHAEDLGEAYVRIIEAPVDRVAGKAFNVGEWENVPTYLEALRAGARARGFGDVTETSAMAPDHPLFGFFGFFADIETATTARNAREILGWHPRHRGFIADVDLYYASFKAASGEDK